MEECPYNQRYIDESMKCSSTCESGNYNMVDGKLFCTQVCPQFYTRQGELKECTQICDMYVLGSECVEQCPTEFFIRVGDNAQCLLQEDRTYYKYAHPRTSKYYGMIEYMTSCGDEFWCIDAGGEKVCVEKCAGDRPFLEEDRTCTSKCHSNVFKVNNLQNECVSECEKYYVKSGD